MCDSFRLAILAKTHRRAQELRTRPEQPSSAVKPDAHGADAIRVIAVPANLPVKAGPVPDRLSIRPMETGRFGLDASFQGAKGAERAYAHEWELIAHEVPHAIHQDATGAWTLSFGPLSAHDLTCVLDAFVY